MRKRINILEDNLNKELAVYKKGGYVRTFVNDRRKKELESAFYDIINNYQLYASKTDIYEKNNNNYELKSITYIRLSDYMHTDITRKIAYHLSKEFGFEIFNYSLFTDFFRFLSVNYIKSSSDIIF